MINELARCLDYIYKKIYIKYIHKKKDFHYWISVLKNFVIGMIN